MADEVRETVQGEGYAVGSLDGMGDGPGFRKIRRELGVTAFGANVIILPEGFDAGTHYHDEQEELYFVHRGRLEFEFGGEGGGEKFLLHEGGVARVDAHTVRHISNPGPGDAVYFIVGGKDGYVGRDGRVPDGAEITRPGGH
jgi:mannose-6-phosphate isomerase-like protein (cupin superfamily)